MGEFLNAPQGIGIAEFRLKYNGGAQLLNQAALPGNAEFGGEVAAHPGDWLNGHIHGSGPHFAQGEGDCEDQGKQQADGGSRGAARVIGHGKPSQPRQQREQHGKAVVLL